MDLPIRYRALVGPDEARASEPGSSPARERVLSVDGAWGAPGLNLSHWPGHGTPASLRRDLSTEIALAFSSLPAAEQRKLARGLVAIENNHYDTDGNCALFAIRHPELALPRARTLIAAAAAGDFFQGADERAFAIDQIVGALADPERSPIRSELAPLGEAARHLRATEYLFERFARILDGELGELAELAAEPLARLAADRADLARAAKDDLAHLDLCVWTAATDAFSTGPGPRRCFDPGRHALFAGATPEGSSISPSVRDRVLAIGPRREGTTYRLVIGTFSWFDLLTRPRPPRPSLEGLAAQLNQLEGTGEHDAVRWRAQPTDTPSPELWFGRAGERFFAEHAEVLEPSRLAPKVVRRALVESLRGALTLPD